MKNLVLSVLLVTLINAGDTITLEMQTFDQKIAKIETKINVLKSRGFKSLSKEEKIKYSNLKKQLLKTYKEEKQAIERTNKKIDSILETLPPKDTEK